MLTVFNASILKTEAASNRSINLNNLVEKFGNRAIHQTDFIEYLFHINNVNLDEVKRSPLTRICKISGNYYQKQATLHAINLDLIKCKDISERRKKLNLQKALEISLDFYGISTKKTKLLSKYKTSLNAYNRQHKFLILNSLNSKLIKSSNVNLRSQIKLSDAYKIILNGKKWTKQNTTKLEILTDQDFQNLSIIKKLINRQYIKKHEISDRQLLEGAAEGMVKSLNDKYSTYFSPKNAKTFTTQISQDFSGIGVYINTIDDLISIVRVIPSGPAYKSGIKKDDVIWSVEGEIMKGKTTDYVARKIIGENNTPVKIGIKRNGVLSTYTIKRGKIIIKNVTKENYGRIMYLKIDGFQGTMIDEINEIVEESKKNMPRKIVIDLRDNPGGYLDYAIKFTKIFLKENDTIVSTINNKGTKTNYKTFENGVFNGIPLVVMINKNSASASEIFAGAIKDYKYGKIIGQKSYGKGSAQTLLNLFDGGLLKLTTELWLTPNGHTIEGIGVQPDKISEEKNINTINDDVLEEALRY